MFTKVSLLVLFAFLFCFPFYTNATDNLPAPPFESLQQQIDELASRFTPPKISYTLNCVNALQLDLDLTVTDDMEIAYYAIQEQNGDPPINIIIFVEPGLSSANYLLGLDLGNEDRQFLLIASDIDGNTSKSLLQIDYDMCYPPCPPGAVCP